MNTNVRSSSESSDLADPLAIFPHRFDGSEIAPIENSFCGCAKISFAEMIIGVARADGDELEDAGIAIAIDHAAGATVADELRGIELVNVAHWFLPKMATIQVQVPIEIKIFVAAEAAELLAFAAQVALH